MAIKKKISNPRFPHWCRIYRVGDVNPFGEDGDVEVLYEGECRIYANTSIRIFEKDTDAGHVVNSDMAVAIPVTSENFDTDKKYRGISDGDTFEGKDANREYSAIVSKDCYTGTMGTIVGLSRSKN